jgi:hypothetical protein
MTAPSARKSRTRRAIVAGEITRSGVRTHALVLLGRMELGVRAPKVGEASRRRFSSTGVIVEGRWAWASRQCSASDWKVPRPAWGSV